VARNPFFTSMCRGQWLNLLTLAFPGCVSFANGLVRECISGLSTDGTSRIAVPPSPRSIQRCGVAASIVRNGRMISTTPLVSPLGCAAPIKMVALSDFLTQPLKMADRALAEVEGWILGVE
jgi:hypothetical protein